MKKVVFEVVKACLLSMLFLTLGLYWGIMNERKEQEAGANQWETVERVAVVNLDEGSDIDGEKINYGSELGVYPNDNFVGASLEEARAGIYNGTYGAYIVIPPTFSKSVESINDFPQKAEMSYAMNPNLSDATRLIVTDEVSLYMKNLNDTLSYVYVTSIMEEFHDVQDGSKTILEHDIEDLNNILAIVPSELSEDIEYTELEKTEYEWEFLDLSEYSEKNSRYIENIDAYYEEVNGKLVATYKEVTDESIKASEDYKNVLSQFENFNPIEDDSGNNILEEGFQKLETEAALTDESSMKYVVDTKISEQAQIEMGYYRELLQQYVDRELARYVKAQEIALAHNGSVILPHMASQTFEDEYNSLTDTDTLTEDEIKNMFKLDTFTPDLTDPNSNILGIEEAYPILVKEGELTEEEKAQKNNIISRLKNNTLISERFKKDTFNTIVPTRTIITDILKEHIVKKAKDSMLTQLHGAEQSLDGVSVKISEEYDRIHAYDPLSEIDASTAKENISSMRNDIGEMQRVVNDKVMKDTDVVNDIYMKSEENISTLKDNMQKANELTKTNVQNTIDTLKAAREGINNENTDILEAFSERLSYTRLGTLENEQAYDFIVEPIEYAIEETQKTISERVLDDNMQLFVIIVICGVLYLACLVTEIVLSNVEKKTRMEENAEE